MNTSSINQMLHQISINTLQKWDSRILDSVILNRENPIIVASSGRAGSTMLFHSVLKSKYRCKVNRKYAQRPLFHLHQLAGIKTGRVYKTHLLYDRLKDLDADIIFVYDDYGSTLSSFAGCIDKFGIPWAQQHIRNLESKCTDPSQLGLEDILNYEQQLKQYVLQNVPARGSLVAIPYEYLWKVDLTKLLGFPIKLPKHRPRQATTTRLSNNAHVDLMNRYYDQAVAKFLTTWNL